MVQAHPSPQPKRRLNQFIHFWAIVCKTIRPMLSDRCLSVYLSVKYRDFLRRAVQKRLNRSICRLGCGLGWAEGSTNSVVFAALYFEDESCDCATRHDATCDTHTPRHTLDFNARQGSRVKVAQHCGMCDIGLNGGAYPLRDLYETFRVCGQFLPRWPLKFDRIRSMVPEL